MIISGEDGASVEEYGWFALGDSVPRENRLPFKRPTLRQIFRSLPFLRRYFLYWIKFLGKKEKLFINVFEPLRHKPNYGNCDFVIF